MSRRNRPRRRDNADALRAEIAALAFEMEEPLHEATNFVHALWLISISSGSGDEEGKAIQTVAIAATEQLEKLKGSWQEIAPTVRQRNL